MDLMAFVPALKVAPDIKINNESEEALHELCTQVPCVEHVCEVPTEKDPLMILMPGNSAWSKLRRWFLRTRIPSPRHPFTRWCLKSKKTLDYEIRQHLKYHPYMIHPFSSFRIFWESAMTLFIVAALLITPVFLTFYFDEHEKWYITNHMIDVVFICDIIIWFFTGYYDDPTRSVTLDWKFVASNYLRGFFILNVLPVLPLEFLAVMFKSMWYLTSLNLLKLLWLRTVIIYSHRLYCVYKINFHLYKITEAGVILVIFVHWAACLEYYVPLVVAKIAGENDASWIRSSYMMKRDTKLRIYLTCVNRALIALSGSAHYLTMRTSEDIVYNLILTSLGFLGFVYLLARFLQFLATFHSTSKRHLKLIQQLQQYIKYKKLPHSLQWRLLTYYNYLNRKGLKRQMRIMKHISPYLREKLLLHNYMDLLSKVELFKHLPQIVVMQLAGVLQPEVFIKNDTLVKAGTRGDMFYIIAFGTVAVYDNTEKEICHLEDGAYFGEIALVMEDEWRVASVVAIENCEVYVLSRCNFQRVLTSHPDLLSHLQDIALVLLEQMTPLEEISSLDSSALAPDKINISSIKAKRRDRVSD